MWISSGGGWYFPRCRSTEKTGFRSSPDTLQEARKWIFWEGEMDFLGGVTAK